MGYQELEMRLGYSFRDTGLLENALTHSSYTNEHKLTRDDCNERLEFLGDAVLELGSSEFLFEHYDKQEGDMTKLRASLVCEPTLADAARQLALGDHLRLGKGEDATGGRFRDSILSDALEAVIGAIYLDGGFTNAKEFIDRFIMNDIEHKKLFYDSKTILQELVQGLSLGEITYELLSSEGPDHCRTFNSEVRIGGIPMGTGSGHTKKLAEQHAAYEAILKIKSGMD